MLGVLQNGVVFLGLHKLSHPHFLLGVDRAKYSQINIPRLHKHRVRQVTNINMQLHLEEDKLHQKHQHTMSCLDCV